LAVESATLGSAASLGAGAGTAAAAGGMSTATMLGAGALGLSAAKMFATPTVPDLGGISANGVTPTTSAPTLLDANSQLAMDQAAQNQQARLSRGRSSTLLTGGQGSGVGQTTSRMLLGS
jgi:hypothetical protein